MFLYARDRGSVRFQAGGIPRLKVVYSKEQPIVPVEDMAISCRAHCICPPGTARKCTQRRQIPGSTAFVPPVVGLIIAGEVIKDLTKGQSKIFRNRLRIGWVSFIMETKAPAPRAAGRIQGGITMADIIDFNDYRDLNTMDCAALRAYLETVRAQIATLDEQEPADMESETYEDWGDRHEELEDLADEIQDRLDEMED